MFVCLVIGSVIGFIDRNSILSLASLSYNYYYKNERLEALKTSKAEARIFIYLKERKKILG